MCGGVCRVWDASMHINCVSSGLSEGGGIRSFSGMQYANRMCI